MKVVIIEDEKLAAERLQELILKCEPQALILGVKDSVKKSVEWFNTNPSPDLVFMDIQLADGLSFEIFEKTIVSCPVIFTTAFDEYAIRAFKVNSIDYLLKPIDLNELKAAIEKFRKTHIAGQIKSSDVFDKVLNALTNNYKQRFVIKVGEHIRSVSTDQIHYFFSLEKATFLHTSDNHNYVIDYSLEQVESLVDPEKFFRVNRKYIIAFGSVKDIITYSNSRLKLELEHSDDQDVIVAREKVSNFKQWLDK